MGAFVGRPIEYASTARLPKSCLVDAEDLVGELSDKTQVASCDHRRHPFLFPSPCKVSASLTLARCERRHAIEAAANFSSEARDWDSEFINVLINNERTIGYEAQRNGTK